MWVGGVTGTEQVDSFHPWDCLLGQGPQSLQNVIWGTCLEWEGSESDRKGSPCSLLLLSWDKSVGYKIRVWTLQTLSGTGSWRITEPRLADSGFPQGEDWADMWWQMSCKRILLWVVSGSMHECASKCVPMYMESRRQPLNYYSGVFEHECTYTLGFSFIFRLLLSGWNSVCMLTLIFCCCWFFFETQSHSVALAALEVYIKTRLPSNSQRSTFLCLCLQNASIEGMHHQAYVTLGFNCLNYISYFFLWGAGHICAWATPGSSITVSWYVHQNPRLPFHRKCPSPGKASGLQGTVTGIGEAGWHSRRLMTASWAE